MSNLAEDQTSDMNNQAPNMLIGEGEHGPTLSPVKSFMSPSLMSTMGNQDTFELNENDLSGTMNRPNNDVYSPVFNFFMGEVGAPIMNKQYASSFGVVKTESFVLF